MGNVDLDYKELSWFMKILYWIIPRPKKLKNRIQLQNSVNVNSSSSSLPMGILSHNSYKEVKKPKFSSSELKKLEKLHGKEKKEYLKELNLKYKDR